MKIEKDKAGHFAAGCVIALLGCFLFNPGVGFGAALIAGMGKEFLDSKDPEHHTVEAADVWFTAGGGLLVVALWMLIA